MDFLSKEGRVVCGSQMTANEFLRRLSKQEGCDILDIKEDLLGKADIKKFGPTAVVLDVSEFPVHVVAEVVKEFQK